jgi:hypothetical protein
MGECGDISANILDLGTRVVSFTPRPLYPQGKNPLYPLYRMLVGPGAGLHFIEKGKISFLCRESIPASSVVQPVLESPYRLSYPTSYNVIYFRFIRRHVRNVCGIREVMVSGLGSQTVSRESVISCIYSHPPGKDKHDALQ